MKNIEEYFETVQDETGKTVGMAIDIEGLAKDRAADIFKGQKARDIFVQGYIEGHTIGAMVAKKNYDRPTPSKLEPQKPKLFLPNER